MKSAAAGRHIVGSQVALGVQEACCRVLQGQHSSWLEVEEEEEDAG
jgi:hypothetical protein